MTTTISKSGICSAELRFRGRVSNWAPANDETQVRMGLVLDRRGLYPIEIVQTLFRTRDMMTRHR